MATATQTKTATKATKKAAKAAAPKIRTFEDFPEFVETRNVLERVNAKLSEAQREAQRIEAELRQSAPDMVMLDLDAARMLGDDTRPHDLRTELEEQRKVLKAAQEASKVATERHRVAQHVATGEIVKDAQPEKRQRLQEIARAAEALLASVESFKAWERPLRGLYGGSRWQPPAVLTGAFQMLEHQLTADGIEVNLQPKR